MDYDFEESVGYWVTVTALSYHRVLNAELAPHDITFRQSQVLGWLVLDGRLSQSELACRMQIEPPTLAGIVDRMERTGWVTRTSCPDDRRKKLIQLTPAAEPVWEIVAQCARRIRAHSTQGLTEEQVATLRDLLRVVHANLNHQPSDPPL